MKIPEYPLTKTFYIIAFEGRKNINYGLNREGAYVVEDGKMVDNDIEEAIRLG